MTNKFESHVPVTQILAAGLALAKFLGHPKDLPAMVPLAGGVQLKSVSKCDKYYLAVSHGCVCQAARDAQKAEAT